MVMATTPPDSNHASSPVEEGSQQTQQATMERDFFVPGEITLARSDEETHPLNIKEVRILTSQPYSDIWKEMKGLRPTDQTKEMKSGIYPKVKDLLDQYWMTHKISINEIDMTYISGWNGSEEGKKVWLRLGTKDDSNRALLKQLAIEVGSIIVKSGYPNMPCIIMWDNYRPRIADHTISQFEGDEMQKATRQPMDSNIAR